nr:glucose-1-phosphate adenylyltransferase small subunit 2, chloroplastic [Ipomoea batatas]
MHTVHIPTWYHSIGERVMPSQLPALASRRLEITELHVRLQQQIRRGVLMIKELKRCLILQSIGIYVVSKDVVVNLLRQKFPGANDFGSEVIPGATSIGLRVQAYLFDGYWEDIGTIEAFYNANLGITKELVPDFNFYYRSTPIYTQPLYLPPKMLDVDVIDNVIGEDCVIGNFKIHHSMVGLRLCISKEAIIKDALLMGADYYESDAD